LFGYFSDPLKDSSEQKNHGLLEDPFKDLGKDFEEFFKDFRDCCVISEHFGIVGA